MIVIIIINWRRPRDQVDDGDKREEIEIYKPLAAPVPAAHISVI